jgi:hypothetical protein
MAHRIRFDQIFVEQALNRWPDAFLGCFAGQLAIQMAPDFIQGMEKLGIQLQEIQNLALVAAHMTMGQCIGRDRMILGSIGS